VRDRRELGSGTENCVDELSLRDRILGYTDRWTSGRGAAVLKCQRLESPR
jgi:hypothetical protein